MGWMKAVRVRARVVDTLLLTGQRKRRRKRTKEAVSSSCLPHLSYLAPCARPALWPCFSASLAVYGTPPQRRKKDRRRFLFPLRRRRHRRLCFRVCGAHHGTSHTMRSGSMRRVCLMFNWGCRINRMLMLGAIRARRARREMEGGGSMFIPRGGAVRGRACMKRRKMGGGGGKSSYGRTSYHITYLLQRRHPRHSHYHHLHPVYLHLHHHHQ